MATTTLKNVKFEVSIKEDAEVVHVEVFAPDLGLDRPRVRGWGLGHGKMKLAERLKKAIYAGVVLKPVAIHKDVHNETFLETSCSVLGRYLNADLRRLDF